MKIQIFAAASLVLMTGCVEDVTHISKVETALNVDGRSYVVERHIGTEEILNTDTAPRYFAVVGDARVACNSTTSRGCAQAIRNARAAQATAAASN